MRVLFISNDNRSSFAVCSAIGMMGHTVDVISFENHDIINDHSFDLIILDVNAEKDKVIKLIEGFRLTDRITPIMVLFPSLNEEVGVAALESGADDFQKKPIIIKELQARVRVLLRRHLSQKVKFLSCGPLQMNVNTRTFMLSNKVLKLTIRERGILEILLMQPEIVVSKERIMSHVLSIQDMVSAHTIETYIYRLRQKLAHPNLTIETVYGEGYILKEVNQEEIKKNNLVG